MRFIAPVEKFTFAIRRDSENLPFIAGCDEENAVRAKSEIPDVFRFRIKKTVFSPDCETRYTLPSGDVAT